MARTSREPTGHRRALRAAGIAALLSALMPRPAAAQQRVPPLLPVTPPGAPDQDTAPFIQPPPAPASPARTGTFPSPPTLQEFYDTLPPFNAPLPPSVPLPPLLYPLPGEPPA